MRKDKASDDKGDEQGHGDDNDPINKCASAGWQLWPTRLFRRRIGRGFTIYVRRIVGDGNDALRGHGAATVSGKHPDAVAAKRYSELISRSTRSSRLMKGSLQRTVR